MTKIKAIIFDVGGVLKTDTDQIIQQDIQKTLGITPEALVEPWKVLADKFGRGAIDEPELWQELYTQTNAPNPLPTESLLLREYKKQYQVNKEVLIIAHELRTGGYQTAILSNTNASHANFNRQQSTYNSFDPVILSHEIGLLKPSPEIFHYALEKLSLAPNETVLVDDLEKNTTAAMTLNMQAILFKNASQLEQDLKQLGVVF